VNTPPELTLERPEGRELLFDEQQRYPTVFAVDADDDLLEFSWFVDGRLVEESAYEVIPPSSAGREWKSYMRVSAEDVVDGDVVLVWVSDGEDAVRSQWLVRFP
jgi:hypothetical protein